MNFKRLDEKKESFSQFVISFAVVVIAAFFLATFVTNYVVMRVQVDGTSMTPTLADEQYVWVRVTKKVKANDIVMFSFDAFNNGEIISLVKRVIATEGETVYRKNRTEIWVKGTDGAERKVHEGFDIEYTLETVTVPTGRFYAMGDNINRSRDSTEFGTVPLDLIVGKVLI